MFGQFSAKRDQGKNFEIYQAYCIHASKMIKGNSAFMLVFLGSNFTKNSVPALQQHCHLASLFGRRLKRNGQTDRPRPTPRRTDGRADEFDSVTLPVTKLYWTSSPAEEEAEEEEAAVSVLANNTCPALSPPRPPLLKGSESPDQRSGRAAEVARDFLIKSNPGSM